MDNLNVVKEEGKLKIMTDTGYFLVEPYQEGVSVMLFDKNNIDGLTEDENGLLGVDLAVVEKYEGKYQAIIWEKSDNESATKKIEYKIRQSAKNKSN